MYSIGIGRHYFVRFLLALVSSLLIAVSGWFVVSAEDFSLPSEYLPSECEEGFEPAPVSECLIGEGCTTVCVPVEEYPDVDEYMEDRIIYGGGSRAHHDYCPVGYEDVCRGSYGDGSPVYIDPSRPLDMQNICDGVTCPDGSCAATADECGAVETISPDIYAHNDYDHDHSKHGDNSPDFLDTDDDGDGIPTKTGESGEDDDSIDIDDDAIDTAQDYNSTRSNKRENIVVLDGDDWDEVSDELERAWRFGKTYGTDAMASFELSDMEDILTRAELARLFVAWVDKFLYVETDDDLYCRGMADTRDLDEDTQRDIMRSCQMGLMGVGMERFDPHGLVTRAQSATVLSRALWRQTHDGGSPWYAAHIDALVDAGLMMHGYPERLETRGYFMTMLTRVATQDTW